MQRVDLARDVRDVVVLEAAHEMRDRVSLANVREELIAEPFALRRALDQARDVDELDDRRHDLLGLTIAAIASSRGSGTATTPTFGSIVQNG